MTKELTLKPIVIDGLSMHVTNVNDLFIQPFQEFVYMEEETNKDNPKPSVEVDLKNANKSPDNASNWDKAKNWVKTMLRRFIAWVGKIAQNIKDAFSKNYTSQIKYVGGNKQLNDQIGDAIQSGKFKPTIKDWPKYHIPLQDIVTHSQNANLKDIIDKAIDSGKNINTLDIKQAYYPKALTGKITNEYSIDQILDDLIQEFGIVMEDGEQKKDGENSEQKLSNTGKMLQKYFLYGDPNPTETITNQLDKSIWDDLVNNILNCEKAITIGIEAMRKDIDACAKDLQQRIENVPKPPEEGNNERPSGKDNDPNDPNYLQQFANLVKDISNEYLINFANTMQKEFFVKSYNLYRDMVQAYKNTNGEYNVQQSTQPNPNATA